MELPRQLWEFQAFLEMPRHLGEFLISDTKLQSWETAPGKLHSNKKAQLKQLN